jgi:hypothetical protein
MNDTPKGKIGRLPKAVREQVNRRLEKGENGRTLVAWLNALPEVQAALARRAGRPGSGSRRSIAWARQGGCRSGEDWQAEGPRLAATGCGEIDQDRVK